MSSTESEKNTLEEQLNEDVNNPESNNTSLLSTEESSTQNKEETSQENQTELSEIETGVSDQSDFDEIINFDHTYLNYRIAKVFLDRESLENSTFDLLTTNIFIYSGDIIDFKSSILINSSNTEAIKTIRQKINTYKSQDIQNKKSFIENIPFYVRTLGFKDTVENLIPIICDLSREKETISQRFFEIFPQFIDEILKFDDKGKGKTKRKGRIRN